MARFSVTDQRGGGKGRVCGDCARTHGRNSIKGWCPVKAVCIRPSAPADRCSLFVEMERPETPEGQESPEGQGGQCVREE